MFKECYTALITPMRRNSASDIGPGIDYEGLRRLIDFQVEQGVNGIVAVGTTGESPTLEWDEHMGVVGRVFDRLNGSRLTIAGTGSNSTYEAVRASRRAYDMGIRVVLTVDCYYNGPSSLELREEYHSQVAQISPELQVIPYIIPGRTGTKMSPHDLAILHEQHPNVSAVKEATGDLENMRLTRRLCGADFDILSGDDDLTYQMMTDPNINASGVISVTSNVAPRAVQEMTAAVMAHRVEKAKELADSLKPLFNMVTVTTIEETQHGSRPVKARSPLAYKTLMNVLGMPAGPCRQPLGKMTKNGLKKVLDNARTVYMKNPEILEPIESSFDVKLGERLYEERFWDGLTYG